MSTDLTIPEPSATLAPATVERVAREIADASWHLPLEVAEEYLNQALALETYLAKRDNAGPIQTAARLLERRIGELSGEPEMGRPHHAKSTARGTLARNRRGEFRLLAAQWKAIEHHLPASRRALLTEARRLAQEAAARKATSQPNRTTASRPQAKPTIADVEDLELTSPPSKPARIPIVRSRDEYPEVVRHTEWSTEIAKLARDAMGMRFDGGFNAQDTTSIEWAQWSWNPVTGCLHNCPYCYARDLAERFYTGIGFAPVLHMRRLSAPLHHQPPDRAQHDLGYRNVFTCSMADLFGKWVPREWIEMVLEIIAQAPAWNFLFLTKFPVRLSEFDFPDNAWVGTTVDCQIRIKNAERSFRKVNAKVKWLSVEPMLEPLRFDDLGAFQWVVIGGASSSNQTPEWHPPRDWSDDLRRQAREVGCMVYEKTNLLERVREYPGHPHQPATLPKSLAYLPSIEQLEG
jgi:protein gp37